MITRDDIFDQDRKERQKYFAAGPDDQVTLPLTKDGFEALLEATAALRDLPVDDASRQVLAGYVHHIPNEQDTTTLSTLGKMLHKSVSNSTTWRIDQDVKLKRIELAKKEAEEAKKIQDNVVNMPPRTSPSDSAQT